MQLWCHFLKSIRVQHISWISISSLSTFSCKSNIHTWKCLGLCDSRSVYNNLNLLQLRWHSLLYDCDCFIGKHPNIFHKFHAIDWCSILANYNLRFCSTWHLHYQDLWKSPSKYPMVFIYFFSTKCVILLSNYNRNNHDNSKRTTNFIKISFRWK